MTNTANIKLKNNPVATAIFLGELADLNSFRGINPDHDAPPKEGLGASEGQGERPSKRGACWSL